MRDASTYRAARRNAAREALKTAPPGTTFRQIWQRFRLLNPEAYEKSRKSTKASKD